MIYVLDRQLTFPNREQYIGTTYDDQAEIRTFCMDRVAGNGVDLAGLTYKLDLKYKNGAYDTTMLEKEIQNDKILLVWTISASMLQVPGTAFINIRAFDAQGAVKWASYQVPVYIKDVINTPGNYEGGLSEFEQLEQRIEEKTESLDANEGERQEAEREREQAETEREKKINEFLGTYQGALEEAERQALLSRSFANGTSGIRDGDGIDNSKYYSEESRNSAQLAANRAADAKSEADRASMYANFVTPDFVIQDNRLYLNNDSTVDFEIYENKLYFKLPTAAT